MSAILVGTYQFIRPKVEMTKDNDQNYQILSSSEFGRQLPLLLEDEVESNPQTQKGLNLGPILRLFRRKILLITGMTTIASAAAVLLTTEPPPIYSGNFQILVEPVTSEEKLVEDAGTLTGNPSTTDIKLDYSTIVEILMSSGQLSPIVEEIQAQYQDFSLHQLKEGLSVEQFGKTKIIDVHYRGLNPELVQLVLDQTAEQYLNYSLESRKTRIGQSIEFIQEQIHKLRERANTLEGQLQRMQQQYNLIEPANQAQELFAKVRAMTDEQLAAQRDLRELRTLRTILQKQLNLSPEEALAASSLSEDPSYQNLLAQIKEAESQIAVESARFQSDSPAIQALLEQRQNLQNLLNQETERILGQALTKVSNSQVLVIQNATRIGLIGQLIETTNQIQVLEVRNQEIENNKKTFERQAQQLPAVTTQYNKLKRELALISNTLNQLESQKETLRVEAAQKEVPWELVYEPQIPKDAEGNPIPKPGDSKTLLMGLMGGLVLGMGASVLYEKYRDIFYSTEDLEEVTKLPILGTIPLTKNPELSANFTESLGSIETTKEGNSSACLFTEAFESLYANIRFRFSNHPVRSLTVCSATPGDGKSTIALQLAQTVAAMGQKVLLVDTNLRSPELHSKLNLSNSKGLSDLLDKKLELNEFIEQSPLADNLFVLSTGKLLPGSSKRLASARMQYLQNQFQEKFHLVIYDTPNLINYTDASFVTANTDGILMVVTMGKTKQSLVKQALSQLNVFGLPILGVVANSVKASSIADSSQSPPKFFQVETAQQWVKAMQKPS
ncbi:MAG: polysaccharide biosynthesis tyrosine autokinase [Symploca sp. SIO2E9]|nr:polysaccharide biosynthesis tyrosine autokinase [Symploca sp. SIO2E9]